MFARVNRSFRDLRESVDRAPGEVFELSEERFAEINRRLNSYVSACDAPEEQAQAKPAAKPRARRRAPANKAKETSDK